MEFLALLTLNILLLINFAGSVNVDQTKEGQHLDSPLKITYSSEEKEGSVLGAYVTAFSASDSLKNELVEKEIVSAPTPTSQPDPSPTQAAEEDEEVLSEQIDNTTTNEDKNLETTDNATHLMNRINSFRNQNGLSNFSYNATVCSFAQTRAQELSVDFSHTGFRNRVDSNSLPYSDYSHVAENIADTDTPDRAFDLWHDSPGHKNNMLSSASYGCIGNLGRLYTLEVWEP